MNVLRANKESLMAVLEAFVYDPLITWRLIQGEGDERRAERTLFYVTHNPEGLIKGFILVMNPDRNANLLGVSVHSNEPLRRLTANENDIFNGMCEEHSYFGGQRAHVSSRCRSSNAVRANTST